MCKFKFFSDCLHSIRKSLRIFKFIESPLLAEPGGVLLKRSPIWFAFQVERTAIRCLQRNIRKYVLVRNWEWWRLYTKVLPLLDVHRAERELMNRNVSQWTILHLR